MQTDVFSNLDWTLHPLLAWMILKSLSESVRFAFILNIWQAIAEL